MAVLNKEIFRQEFPNFRSIRLSIATNGDIKIDAQDMGKLVQETWGDSDYEFWVDVPSSESSKLLFALLNDKYQGRSGAVDEFKNFCIEHNISHDWNSWT